MITRGLAVELTSVRIVLKIREGLLFCHTVCAARCRDVTAALCYCEERVERDCLRARQGSSRRSPHTPPPHHRTPFCTDWCPPCGAAQHAAKTAALHLHPVHWHTAEYGPLAALHPTSHNPSASGSVQFQSSQKDRLPLEDSALCRNPVIASCGAVAE